MRSIIKEPFFHFIVLGGLIFILYGWLNKDTQHPDGYDITITPDQQVRMAVQYQKNFGELPDSTIMQNLIAEEIKNEIFYREALRLGLDADDEIIRRRLKQKYEFIQMDNLSDKAPSETALKTYFEKNQQSYRTPLRYSFEHHYFSPDKRKSPKNDAHIFIDQGGSADPFHIPSPLSNQDLNDIRNAFGFQFSEEIQSLLSNSELAILESGFGIHVVKVHSLSSPVQKSYEEVKSQVYQDYVNQSRKIQNDGVYKNLLSKYDIKVTEL